MIIQHKTPEQQIMAEQEKRLKRGSISVDGISFIINHLQNSTLTKRQIAKAIKAKKVFSNEYLKSLAEDVINESKAGFKKTDKQSYLISKLATATDYLSHHPIQYTDPLYIIMKHYDKAWLSVVNYGYTGYITKETDEDFHRLDEILFHEDSSYILGNRELADKGFMILQNWSDLCQHSETYHHLANVIRLGDLNCPFSTKELLLLLIQTDHMISECGTRILSDKYPLVDISLEDKITGLRHEILKYLTDNGYASLTKDHGFKHMPENIRKYEYEIACSKVISDSRAFDLDYYHDMLDLYDYAMKIYSDAYHKSLKK